MQVEMKRTGQERNCWRELWEIARPKEKQTRDFWQDSMIKAKYSDVGKT
jgi:hypothetical protein